MRAIIAEHLGCRSREEPKISARYAEALHAVGGITAPAPRHQFLDDGALLRVGRAGRLVRAFAD